MSNSPVLGSKIRAIRRSRQTGQAELAKQLDISPSYLNLIESGKRPVPGELLLRVARALEVQLDAFAHDDEGRLLSDLTEAFSDPLFADAKLTMPELREFSTSSPSAARSVLSLYRAYQEAKERSEGLASRLEGTEVTAQPTLPSEEVSDFLQSKQNHFPELELEAEDLCRRARLDVDDLYTGLVRTLEKEHGVHVRIARGESERGTLRRYSPDKKELTLSELLPTRSRTFQLAHQLGLLGADRTMERLLETGHFLSEPSRALSRVSLANYFAGAVLLPYDAILRAAREERYDIDVLGRRFRVGFEQVAHRLTTLRRQGHEGVPFHMIRIDVAGNISKRFSASGIRFARYSGVCARWNIFQAFLTPGMIRIQLSRMPDGFAYFCLARTIQKDSGGYHAQRPVQALGLGCRVEYAKELVYSDGIDLTNLESATPVGVTCRMCDRADCEQRVLPSLHQPLEIDTNVRGLSLYNAGKQQPLFHDRPLEKGRPSRGE